MNQWIPTRILFQQDERSNSRRICMIVFFQKDKEMLLVLHLPGDHGIVFRFPCPVFGGRGVQNLDQGGAFAPPFAMPRSLVPCGFQGVLA